MDNGSEDMKRRTEDDCFFSSVQRNKEAVLILKERMTKDAFSVHRIYILPDDV